MKKSAPKPLTPGQIAAFRARLLAARRRVLGQLGDVEDGLRSLVETREGELGQRSQMEVATAVFTRLGDDEFARFCRIEGALQRIVFKSYGFCSRCSTPIAIGRLRADPSAALCTECARAQEARHRPAEALEEASEEAPAKAPPPGDLRVLDDAEIAALVVECFREEVGEALADVRVICRRAAVTLCGDVASEELREVALRIVEDEMGLEATDRLRVSSLAGEGVARPQRRRAVRRSVDELADELAVDLSDAAATSENVFEVEEEGLTYSPPTRPTAGSD